MVYDRLRVWETPHNWLANTSQNLGILTESIMRKVGQELKVSLGL